MSITDILKGNLYAAARLIREVDDNLPSARTQIEKLFPHTGRAHIIGVTGPPGSGKSSLLDRMICAFREKNQTVGVVLIDPTSPFSGGAILGDRLRMQHHTSDDGVFIRSVATRGSLGGLSRSTYDIVTILDAMGKDVILIETIGTGQDEVDVVYLVQTNIVVSIPGMGDGIQAIKSGILESGDIFVVNKADLPYADITASEIKTMLDMRDYTQGDWKPPVVQTSTLHDQSMSALMEEIDRHRGYYKEHFREAHREKQIEKQFSDILRDRLFQETKTIMQQNDGWDGVLVSIKLRHTDLYSAVETTVKKVLKPQGK